MLLGELAVLTDLYRRLTGLRRRANFERAFLSRRQFARELSRERIRATRRGIPFCVASIVVEPDHRSLRSSKVARLILRHLRVTDEKAMLAPNEFAVLLVDTTQAGGQAVVARLRELFAANELCVRMTLKVHDPSSCHRDTSSPHDDDSTPSGRPGA